MPYRNSIPRFFWPWDGIVNEMPQKVYIYLKLGLGPVSPKPPGLKGSFAETFGFGRFFRQTPWDWKIVSPNPSLNTENSTEKKRAFAWTKVDVSHMEVDVSWVKVDVSKKPISPKFLLYASKMTWHLLFEKKTLFRANPGLTNPKKFGTSL